MDKRPSKITIENEENQSSLFLPVFAIVALGLFLTLCWYAYNYYIDQQKKGDVYYIKADKSPLKVKPDNPGGLVVENQDKQIFNAMVGNAENLDGKINTVEAEEPASKEDIANAVKVSAGGGSDDEVPEEFKDTDTQISEEAAQINLPGADDNKTEGKTIGQAPVVVDNETKADVKAEPEVTPEVKVEAVDPEVKKEAPKNDYVVTKEKDEATGANKTTVTLKADEKPAKAAAPAPKSMGGKVGGKGFYVQISSHKNMADLEGGWKKFSSKFSSVYSGVSRNVTEATINGAKFYRLSFGPYSDRNAAIAKCTTLKAQKQDCLVQAY